MVSKGKKQLGWRKKGVEETLFEPFFKTYYAEGVHLAAHGKVTESWKTLIDLLWKAPPFSDYPKVSQETLKTQLKMRIAEFETKFGWKDGRCANLSGESGDLGVVDSIIRNIKKDEYDAAQKKKTEEADKKRVDGNEVALILKSLGETSKRKRDIKSVIDREGDEIDEESSDCADDITKEADRTATPSSKRSSLTNTPTSSFFAQGLEILRTQLGPAPACAFSSTPPVSALVSIPVPSVKVPSINIEWPIEKHLKEDSLRFADVCEFLRACYIKDPSTTDIDFIEDLGLIYLIEVYCSPGKGFDVDYFCQSLLSCCPKLSPLSIRKVYNYFNRTKNEYLSNLG
jgi:hypothetical protein